MRSLHVNVHTLPTFDSDVSAGIVCRCILGSKQGGVLRLNIAPHARHVEIFVLKIAPHAEHPHARHVGVFLLNIAPHAGNVLLASEHCFHMLLDRL